MLTGMPISISLGLTVLTFLFTHDHGADRVGRAEAVHRHREVRDHGDPVLHPRRQLPDPRRRGATDDQLRHRRWSATGTAASAWPACWPARCSPRSPAARRRRWSRSARSSCRRWSSRAFPKRFGAGVITTSGALGILIPPSIVMVMYAVATNTSVGALFIAGIIPGIVLATMLGSRPGGARASSTTRGSRRPRWAERWRTFRESIWGLLLIVIVIGGIYTGIFTPTEAAAMSAVYAFFVAVFVYKDMTLAKVPKVLLDSANMSGDAALHHHQRGAVLLPHDLGAASRRSSPRGCSTRASASSRSCCSSTSCCCSPATSWSRRRSC